MADGKTIDIVDDDSAIRDSLGLIFEVEGYHVRAFAGGAPFMATAIKDPPSAVLLDVHMPGKSGLDILRDLGRSGFDAPIFIISGQGDIPMAVEAIKNGAFDFIEKPFDAETVLERVGQAIDQAGNRSASPSIRDFPGHEMLTPRESEVLDRIADGLSNKEAGRALGISPRTVEVHRARIMEKVGARNTADLIRIVLSAS